MIAVVLGAVLTSTPALVAWIDREVAGRGRLPALASVVAEAESELALARLEEANDWRTDARWRAWIPDIETRVGTDRSLDVRDATTTSWVRTGEGFGLQVRLRWSLSDALFNDGVLKVDRALRARGKARYAARDRLIDLYFDRLALEVRLMTRPTSARLLKAARVDGLLRTVTGNRIRFGDRAGNPWPGEVRP